MATIKQLRAHYVELNLGTLRSAKQMTAEQLQQRITSHIEFQDRMAAQAIDEQRAKELKEAQRKAAIERRAAGRPDPEDNLWMHLLMRCKSSIARFEKTRDEFTANLLKSPTHALGWARDLFSEAAEYELAHELLEVYAAGIHYDDMKTEMLARLTRQASYCTSRSTSPTSNLVDDAKLQALAKIF